MDGLMDVEKDLLRAFYNSWREFHAIPRTPFNRHKLEHAAQTMVDAANTVKAYDEPCAAKPEQLNG
jgi:hypothetical protein